LLDLIEKRKLSINQISLAAIADDYVAEIKRRISVVPEEVAQFLVVASTLMLIKSRSLIPNLPLTGEDEGTIRDLEKRLMKLQRIRELSRHIAKRAAEGKRMYGRNASDFPVLFYPPEHITARHLLESARAIIEILSRYTGPVLPEKSIQTMVSLEEKIQELMARIEKSLAHSFQSFISSAKEKTDIIVSFLALLELVKQGRIAVEQGNAFGDITIQNTRHE
ncbi:MAG: ScpA family protein, partial [Patescibacteria group bacterium]